MDPRRRRLRNAGALAVVLAGAFILSRFSDGTMAAEAPDPFGYAEQVALDAPTGSREQVARTMAALPPVAALPTPPTFAGYECTEDCSGHEAGYEWAAEQEIADPDDCGGNSDSFIEGCVAYAEENAEPEAEGPELTLY